MTEEVAATRLQPAFGESSFLGRRELEDAPAVGVAAAPPATAQVAPEPEQPRDHVALAPRQAPLRSIPADASLGRLVRTSVSLYEHDQTWLKDVAEQRGSVGVRRATKDFVARGLIRAVIELDPELDLRGITLDDEDEFVERVKLALAGTGRQAS